MGQWCRRYGYAVLTSVAIALSTPPNGKSQEFAGVSRVEVGPFALAVPDEWKAFTSEELNQLRRQFVAQSEDIYRQYSGKPDPTGAIDVMAFHAPQPGGVLALVALSIPPEKDIMNLLIRQAQEKGQWGVRQGYIREYNGAVPFEYNQVSGFYVELVGKNGNLQISGALEHRQNRGALLQLSLLCSNVCENARHILTSITASVSLRKSG